MGGYRNQTRSGARGGRNSYILEPCTLREWEWIEKHASAILYRYWHKERDSLPTPAHLGEIIARDEGWPNGGMFVPTLRIEKKKVEIDIDYLSYAEIPVYADARSKQKKFRLGKTYDRLLTWVKTQPGWDRNNSLNATVANARLLWEGALNQWYENNPLIRGGFEPNEWRKFWNETLHNWSQIGGESTDPLLDRFTAIMRKKYPRYGLTNEELGRLDKKRGKLTEIEIMSWRVQYHFWIELSMNVLYPLTMCAGLLSPIFTDQKMWEDDVLALTKKDCPEPMPIYGPCSNIATTELGLLLAISYKQQSGTKNIWV